MITMRSPKKHEARTVIAGEALKVGMFVKLAQGAAIGEVPVVMKATAADQADATKLVGIVSYIPDNDLTVPYILTPQTRAIAVNTGEDNATDIPSGALCVFWYDKPIVGFQQAAVHSGMDVSTVREGTAVAIHDATSTLAVYASGDTARDVVVGIVYQNDGEEITVILNKI
jgi:hypothetical protein